MKSLKALDETKEMKNLICDKFPEKCPFCYRGAEPEFIQAFLNTTKNNNSLQVIFRCPLKDCGHIFISYYDGEYRFPTDYRFSHSKPNKYLKKSIPENIIRISKNFELIYNQAFLSDQLGLTAICGAGYRKALEFLIKDYLIFKKPKTAKRIKIEFLGEVIEKRVNNKQLKEVAKRAAWLGNDELHYERIWADKDVADLKKAIDIVVNWIESEQSAEEFLKSMPEKMKIN
jgi:hypothetical protein